MEEVGFTEVDVAWRKDGFFVAGGRKCLLSELKTTSLFSSSFT